MVLLKIKSNQIFVHLFIMIFSKTIVSFIITKWHSIFVTYDLGKTNTLRHLTPVTFATKNWPWGNLVQSKGMKLGPSWDQVEGYETGATRDAPFFFSSEFHFLKLYLVFLFLLHFFPKKVKGFQLLPEERYPSYTAIHDFIMARS